MGTADLATIGNVRREESIRLLDHLISSSPQTVSSHVKPIRQARSEGSRMLQWDVAIQADHSIANLGSPRDCRILPVCIQMLFYLQAMLSVFSQIMAWFTVTS